MELVCQVSDEFGYTAKIPTLSPQMMHESPINRGLSKSKFPINRLLPKCKLLINILFKQVQAAHYIAN